MGLLTNFSSGELSANLFGRIDLPQYHGGAARLENWDVIPTGGIKRRSGMERLLSKNISDGRLISFVINKNLKFLLYIMHKKIKVLKIKNGILIENQKPFENTTELQLYSLEHIHDVQYVQNYDLMILCHENYPPLEIMYKNEKLEISTLVFDFYTPVDADKNITEKEKYGHTNIDEQYNDNGWLTTEGNYPATVCFFNGRLVFAGSKNNPQKIFFSAIKEENKPYNFSTKKIFKQLKKEYVVIQGSVDKENKKIIYIKNEEGFKFTSALENYYIDSPFYKDGTKIFRLQGDELILTEDTIIETIPQSVLDDINNMERNAVAIDSFPSVNEVEIASYTVRVSDHPITGIPQYDTKHVYLTPGATKLKVRVYHDHSDSLFHRYSNIYNLNNNDVKKYEENNSYFFNFVYSKLETDAINNSNYDHNKINNVINTLKNNSLATMKYELNIGDMNKIYYNFPSEIYNIVEGRLKISDNIYIPFYTREIIENIYPTPDCGFTFDIASGKNDAIKWLAVNRGLIVGTEMGEYLIPPDVHATNTQAIALSSHGSDNIPGLALGDAILFFKSGRKGLVEYYPNENDNFRANNMALLAQQMLHESPAKEFDYATNPYAKLYVTREDGQLVTLLYERMTGTFAWSRITTGEVIRDLLSPEEMEAQKEHYKKYERNDYGNNPFVAKPKWKRFIEGEIISCAVLPGENGFDDVYLIVKRGGEFFLEMLREDGTVYLDSWREWKFTTEEDRQNLLNSYDAESAVIYDESDVKVYALKDADAQLPLASEEGNRRFVGYPYRSVMKSMPVVKDGKMNPVHLTAMCVILFDSYEPIIGMNDFLEKDLNKTVYNGVIKLSNLLSGQDRSTQFYITHNAPNKACVLSVYTEV